jgi:hypothetical protein
MDLILSSALLKKKNKYKVLKSQNSVSDFLCSHWLLSPVVYCISTFVAGFRNHDRRLFFGTILSVAGGCRKIGTGFLRRVTGRRFTISKRFPKQAMGGGGGN